MGNELVAMVGTEAPEPWMRLRVRLADPERWAWKVKMARKLLAILESECGCEVEVLEHEPSTS